jgi:glutamate-5-semialdehyde dehydrogenase
LTALPFRLQIGAMTQTHDATRPLAQAARDAARALGKLDSARKDRALLAMADALLAHEARILAANAKDLAQAREAGMAPAMLDRLALDPKRIAGMAASLREVAALPDPVGEVVEAWDRPNGMKVETVRLPLGVILMIYEARPNATAEAAALCLKSGNAAVLRGGKEALGSNLAVMAALQEGMAQAEVPPMAVQLVQTADREVLEQWLQHDDLIDLCIPRGGQGLIDFVRKAARMPVVRHAQGVCHVYVDQAADLEMAVKIAVNSKASRPGVCNSAECLLVDVAVAARALPLLGKALVEAKVALRADARARAVLDGARVPCEAAKPTDFGNEFLDLIMAVAVVDGLDGALAHIARYSTGHTDTIVTQDEKAAARFVREVESSGVMVNVSTRMNDGGQLGLGAEIGISTSRLHAFGPMGLRELTTQKYVVRGNGQVRG